jgi:hypothetical protein
MLLKNPTSVRVVCEALGFACDPGDTVEVENGYCAPRVAVPGCPKQPSAIKLLCPQLVPADDSLLDAWKSDTLDLTPTPPPPPTAKQLEATGMAPGVAALAAAGAAEVAPKPVPKPAPKARS